ncbi:hypothetical protein GCM10011521_04100 [Arenimonas soli]|uniref:Uncharacterized protein n=1 Tax=Arenimonas soli TaxID=2269504 RepID=A0ABQ1HB56_9GAMM|nr:hypothetical protein GCM10011521_04100 [Arenimonas soli]
MAKRGRPKADNKERDRAVVFRVVKAIFDRRGVNVALRDRAEVGGRLRKQPAASAYKIAREELWKFDGIRLSLGSIERIFKAGKDEFIGEGDIARRLRDRTAYLKRCRERGLVRRDDGPALPGPRVRIRNRPGN